MRFIKMLLILALFFFGLLFFTENKEQLSQGLKLFLDLYVYDLRWESQVDIPFFVVAIAMFAIGVLFTVCFFFLDKVRATKVLLSKKSEIRGLKKEIDKLKIDFAKTVNAKTIQPKKALPVLSEKNIETEASPVISETLTPSATEVQASVLSKS